MGKSRRNRAGAASRRRDPISKPVKPPSDPELAALREQKILPVVRDLQSVDPKMRSSAASAISNIIQDSRCRKLLLREQVVHTVLGQTLTDSALESRAAGWGILQVLAQEEEPDFCVHLYRQDVVTAMEYAARAVSERLGAGAAPPTRAEEPLLLSIAGSLVSLATALAEARDDILVSLSASSAITSFLLAMTTASPSSSTPSSSATDSSVSVTVAGLRTDALACLMILTEDNTALAETILSRAPVAYETLRALRKDVSGDSILSCAVLHNIFVSLQDKTVDHQIVDDSAIVPTLAKTLAEITADDRHDDTQGWSSPFQYRQLALEILASMGTSLMAAGSDGEGKPEGDAEAAAAADDDDDEDMGDDGEDGDEKTDADKDGGEGGEEDEEGEDEGEMDEDEMRADMDMVTGPDDEAPTSGIDDLPVLKALLRDALPEMMRVASLPVRSDESLQLQALALSALNNVAWSVSVLDLSDDDNRGIQQAWEPVGRAIWSSVIAPILSSDTADVALAKSVTGLAWAVARTFAGASLPAPLEKDEHRRFMTLYQATKGRDLLMAATATSNGSENGNSSNNKNKSSSDESQDPFQSLGVKCIGVLGQLALHPTPVAINREIGTFLVTLVAGLPDQTPAADAVEALNQLFDMYADESQPCDREVFWSDGFLSRLEESLPKARAMAKSVDKRRFPELRSRADEAVLNLSRFLSYKKKNKP
ncbi:ribosomal large subunit biogenesis [Geosmithia morbida]|uniref:Ribosomal large subunit biogenesis n=1 Tax=Geosmithia morbida TaxID=1094350 RepID=A0A9P5D7J1_9HYPO|nr:ribosomal large subunit biogenesis [Geosmithia morbida]KAF4126691.1 ribosomal large subunit biogenesis [Geosmithia morbida]